MDTTELGPLPIEAHVRCMREGCTCRTRYLGPYVNPEGRCSCGGSWAQHEPEEGTFVRVRRQPGDRESMRILVEHSIVAGFFVEEAH